MIFHIYTFSMYGWVHIETSLPRRTLCFVKFSSIPVPLMNSINFYAFFMQHTFSVYQLDPVSVCVCVVSKGILNWLCSVVLYTYSLLQLFFILYSGHKINIQCIIIHMANANPIGYKQLLWKATDRHKCLKINTINTR